MDLYFNLILIIFIVSLFIIIKFSQNPYVYVGIIVLSITGLVVTMIEPVYIQIGINTTLTTIDGVVTGAVSYPIKETLSTYNYIFQLFYLMGIIGSVVFWTIDNPKKEDF